MEEQLRLIQQIKDKKSFKWVWQQLAEELQLVVIQRVAETYPDEDWPTEDFSEILWSHFCNGQGKYLTRPRVTKRRLNG
jgi:hypothetical protein